VRLFVAFELREDVREAVRELIAQLKPLGKGARWVRPEGMHVTLKFIGEVDASNLDAIRSALAPIHSQQPVEMYFRGVGFFPDERRPRVAWCGIEASANMAALAADIESALEPLKIERESRDFAPHLTLGRFNPPGRAEELVRVAKGLQAREFGSARETEFHLFESILGRSGAEYKKLASFPLVRNSL
jgi:2'-5' RNA ligase